MAFKTFSRSKIENIDVNQIPADFVDYFKKLPESRKEDIRSYRPDLAEAIEGSTSAIEIDSEGNDKKDDFQNDIGVENNTADADTQEAESNPIIDAWEDVSIASWKKDTVVVPVLVTKIMPDGNRVCRIHRRPLEEKQLKFKEATGSYNMKGFFCPDCVDFFLEEKEAEEYFEILGRKGISVWAQPLEDTLREWQEEGIPQDVPDDMILYAADTWTDDQTTCPLHPDTLLTSDSYRKEFLGREIVFEAFYCPECKKTILRMSEAQRLEDELAEKGIPAIQMELLRKEPKKIKKAFRQQITPDYIIADGVKDVFDFPDEVEWTELDENDTVVIEHSRYCPEEDHETRIVLCLIQVQEKREGFRLYLVLMGYCEECDQYYIDKEDYELIISKGRPSVTVIDNTDSFYKITSGSAFDQERDHLNELEGDIDKAVRKIEANPAYVEKYGVSDYDDGGFNFNKNISAGLRKERVKLLDYEDKPYGYRADITFAGSTEVFYLGPDDIILNEKTRVISYNSAFGRKLVNYKTIKIIKDGKQYKVKRRRDLDITHAMLFGFTEQSDEDVIFSSGITDAFLVRVLNMRKKQHQLLEIIATVQENQNKIIDLPLSRNLIVQGCAGSGKTMVMLHRLSSLKYNHPDFDFEKAVILTPNSNFNTHISGLASSLQLGYIERLSVEEYYLKLLEKYDNSFKTKARIIDEMSVDQVYVDYIYSDEFQTVLMAAVQKSYESQRELFQTAELVLKGINSSYTLPKNEQRIDRITSHLQKDISGALNTVKVREQQLLRAKEAYDSAISKLKENDAYIIRSKDFLKETMLAETAKVFAKLKSSLEEREERVRVFQENIDSNQMEYERVDNEQYVFFKRRQLNRIQRAIDEENKRKEEVLSEILQIRKLLEDDYSELSEDELIHAFESMSAWAENTGENIRMIKRARLQLDEAEGYKPVFEDDCRKYAAELEEANNNMFEQGIAEKLEDLKDRINVITPKAIYNAAYNDASEKAYEKVFGNNEKKPPRIRGLHRFDLYLQLLFAVHYFGYKVGDNDLICIDEGQDLTPSEYRLIRNINTSSPIFNIYGDTRQLLKYGRGISDWKQIDDVIGMHSTELLNENYRNTNQITDYCNQSFGMTMALTGVDGHRVREIIRSRLEETLSRLRINDERIALILPRKARKENYVHKEELPDRISSVLGSSIENGKIAVVYVDEVKGVEFDRVFVVPNAMTQNEKYIAFTRALSNLTIVIDENLDVKKTSKTREKKKTTNPKPKGGRNPDKADSNIHYGKVPKSKNKKKDQTPNSAAR